MAYDEGAKGRWWGSGNLKRGGGRLEGFKFSLYLSIPVFASFIYSYPEHMNSIVNRFRYIVYPAEGPRPPAGEDILERLKAEKMKRAAEAEHAKAAAAAAAVPARKKWLGIW